MEGVVKESKVKRSKVKRLAGADWTLLGTLEVGDELRKAGAQFPAVRPKFEVLFLADVSLVEGHGCLCPNLPARSFCNQQCMGEGRIAPSLEAFGNVRGDRDGCAADLVSQREVAVER
jgi:hypothetical protein